MRLRMHSLVNSTARTLASELFNHTHEHLNDTGPDRSTTHVVLTELRANVDFTKTAVASGHLFMILVGLVAICLFCFVNSMFSIEEACDSGDESALKTADKLADNLRRTIRKLPVTRTSKTGHSKERFIAVIPGDPKKQVRRSDGEVTVVQKWEGGKVAWWRDARAFEKRESPKGDVSLKSVVGAHQDNSYEVEIEYTGGLATKNLLLFFPSRHEASEWVADFSKLLQIVRPPKAERTVSRATTGQQTIADAVRKSVASFHSTLLVEKGDSESDLSGTDSDRGN